MSDQKFKKPPALLRWTVLIMISLGMMGNYYIYDSIGPDAYLLIKQLGFTQSGVSLLNAIYSFPNIFMVFMGGVIIDRIGTKKSTFLFTLLIMIGSILTCLKGNLVYMATGRLIFGIGAESMIIAVTTVIARWYKGKQLSFAFGLNLTIARIGTYLAQTSTGWASHVYEKGWQHPLYIAAAAGFFALLTIIIFYFLDWFAEKHYDLPKEGSQDKIEIKKLFSFSSSFWYISLLCFVFYSAMFPFTSTIGNIFFQHIHHASSGAAGFLVGVPILTAMVFTPLFGLLADYIGKRSRLMMIGSLTIVPVYLLLGYGTHWFTNMGLPEAIHIKFALLSFDYYISPNQLIPLIFLGLAFSLVPAVMWPAVALMIDAKRLGTAYGLMTMIQNIGLFGFNLLIGFSNTAFGASEKNPAGYIPSVWIFAVCGILGIVFSLLLHKSATAAGAVNLEKPMKEIQ
jgi:MFS family permease